MWWHESLTHGIRSCLGARRTSACNCSHTFPEKRMRTNRKQVMFNDAWCTTYLRTRTICTHSHYHAHRQHNNALNDRGIADPRPSPKTVPARKQSRNEAPLTGPFSGPEERTIYAQTHSYMKLQENQNNQRNACFCWHTVHARPKPRAPFGG